MRCRILLLLLLCGAGSGCATGRTQQVCAQCPQGPTRGVVYAINGAGSFLASTTTMRKVIQDDQLPLCVETFAWTHGYGRFLADQMDYGHARAEGEELARQIVAYKQRCPCGEVFLISHSAGSAVALAAAESLPPGSIDRMVLLSPAVSADYDLRPALACCRQGIDVFYSARDRFYLGFGAAIVGTTDREWTAPAGRVGFRPVIGSAQDECLYRKLYAHPWEPDMACTGNSGGHMGSYQPEFLHTYVMPLLR